MSSVQLRRVRSLRHKHAQMVATGRRSAASQLLTSKSASRPKGASTAPGRPLQPAPPGPDASFLLTSHDSLTYCDTASIPFCS